jgi:CheY-like chemotaxis protein
MGDQSLSAFRFLVVDHDRFSLRLVSEMLHAFGAEQVSLARSADEALTRLHHAPFDLMIADSGMRPVGGLALVSHLRTAAHSPARYLPVVLIAGDAAPPPGDAGVDSVVRRPFAPGELREGIAAAVEARRDFIVTATYAGPDRRRREDPAGYVTDRRVSPALLRRRHTWDGQG